MGTASRKGYALEAQVRDYLTAEGLPVVRPQHAGASRDIGDLVGIELGGRPLLIECKNHKAMALAGWVDAARAKAAEDDLAMAVVVHKRVGRGRPEEQYVTMTLGDLVTLLKAANPD